VRKGCPAVEANVGRNDAVMKCFEAGEGEALGWDDRGKQRRASGRRRKKAIVDVGRRRYEER
jgi:hypothetical protein